MCDGRSVKLILTFSKLIYRTLLLPTVKRCIMMKEETDEIKLTHCKCPRKKANQVFSNWRLFNRKFIGRWAASFFYYKAIIVQENGGFN